MKINKSVKYAFLDAALYFVMYVAAVIFAVYVLRTDVNGKFSAGELLDSTTIWNVVQLGVVFYAFKIFVLSTAYRSDEPISYTMKGHPLRFALLGFYAATIALFGVVDYASVVLTYTHISSGSTDVTGIVYLFIVAANVVIMVVSLLAALILRIINKSLLKRRMTSVQSTKIIS